MDSNKGLEERIIKQVIGSDCIMCCVFHNISFTVGKSLSNLPQFRWRRYSKKRKEKGNKRHKVRKKETVSNNNYMKYIFIIVTITG
jgi:hypothetical protein